MLAVCLAASLFAAPKKGYLGVSTGFSPLIGGEYVQSSLYKKVTNGGVVSFEYTRPVTDFLRTGATVGVHNVVASSDSPDDKIYPKISFSMENRNIFTPFISKGNNSLEINTDFGVHIFVNGMDEYFVPHKMQDPYSPEDSIVVLLPQSEDAARASISTGATYTLPAKRNVSLGTFVNCQMIGITNYRVQKVVFGLKFYFHEKKIHYNPSHFNHLATL